MAPQTKWDSACIIGFGKHAAQKILPALDEIYKGKVFIVTRDLIKVSSIKYKYFSSVEESLRYLSERTCYVLATPPHTHFYFSKIILDSGRDLLVEKPSFFTNKELKDLMKIAISKNLVLAEMFMYLENKSTKKLLKKIERNFLNLNSIDFNFTIPSIPANTYRDEKSIENSVISDMGCYPFSFLSYLNIEIENFECNRIKINKPKYVFYNLVNKLKPEININIGSTGFYQNSIRINFKNKTGIEISPFFYGLEGLRREISIDKEIFKIKLIKEKNAFKELFSRSRESWLKDQNNRFNKMSKVVKVFEKFSNLF